MISTNEKAGLARKRGRPPFGPRRVGSLVIDDPETFAKRTQLPPPALAPLERLELLVEPPDDGFRGVADVGELVDTERPRGVPDLVWLDVDALMRRSAWSSASVAFCSATSIAWFAAGRRTRRSVEVEGNAAPMAVPTATATAPTARGLSSMSERACSLRSWTL